ncbi:MAG: HIT family protein [Verrucomicrobia bacterium]|nr:HIT family protein [Verrucomicrobiota bacterium]
MNRTPCPFCHVPPERVLLETGTTLAFLDAYPVTEGHTLVIPKRHVTSIFELSPEELGALWAQVAAARHWLVHTYSPDAFNIGVNDGPAAGQTIPHAHIHVIPRRKGDAPEPRGGIRWIMPEKARYW